MKILERQFDLKVSAQRKSNRRKEFRAGGSGQHTKEAGRPLNCGRRGLVSASAHVNLRTFTRVSWGQNWSNSRYPMALRHPVGHFTRGTLSLSVSLPFLKLGAKDLGPAARNFSHMQSHVDGPKHSLPFSFLSKGCKFLPLFFSFSRGGPLWDHNIARDPYTAAVRACIPTRAIRMKRGGMFPRAGRIKWKSSWRPELTGS